MRILAYQPKIGKIRSRADRRAHVGHLVKRLQAIAHKEGAINLIVLPELSTVEYSVASFDLLAELAEPLFGESFDAMSTLAKSVGAAICFGMPREDKGHYFISQIVIDAHGHYLTHYDKVHLAQFGACSEKDYFTRGQRLAVFEHAGLRLGIVICYDFRFSELIRLLVDVHGVDVIIHPVAFTRDGTYESWPHFVVCRALENQVYFLSVNRAGEQWGGSVLCPPWMDEDSRPVTLGIGEAAHSITVDRMTIDSVRAKYPFREDRLSDYATLASGLGA